MTDRRNDAPSGTSGAASRTRTSIVLLECCITIALNQLPPDEVARVLEKRAQAIRQWRDL